MFIFFSLINVTVSNITVKSPLFGLFVNKVESTGFNPNSTVEIKFSL